MVTESFKTDIGIFNFVLLLLDNALRNCEDVAGMFELILSVSKGIQISTLIAMSLLTP